MAIMNSFIWHKRNYVFGKFPYTYINKYGFVGGHKCIVFWFGLAILALAEACGRCVFKRHGRDSQALN